MSVPLSWMFLDLLLIAWLTAGGMAVRSVSRIWLRHWAERRLRGAGAADTYLERPQRLLAASDAGVAVALVFAGATVGASNRGGALVGAVITLTVGIVVLGQIVPRALARRWPSVLAPVVLPVLQGVAIVATPLTFVGRWVARPWLPRRADGPAEVERDAVQDLLREGELEGVGAREEIAIISGVVEFGDKRVREVMTPRAEIFALEESTPPRVAAQQIAQTGYSRVPVYRGSVDDVIGMIHAFDVLKAGGEAFPRLRRIFAAGPDDPCNELLFRMLRERLHLAVVREPSGRTLGLVSLEDLLEELVGDIRDEHDEPDVPRGSPPP